METFWEWNIDIHHLFIDFQAAYDTVHRTEIKSEMYQLGFPPKISYIVQNFN